MTIRPRTPSLFRPRKPIDQGVLTENRKLVDDIDRRGLLRGAVSLGALTMLTGCDVSENDSVQKALRAVVTLALFVPQSLLAMLTGGPVIDKLDLPRQLE